MTGRAAKSKLLDDYIEVTGFERKYAIKVLGGSRRKAPRRSKRGKKREGSKEIRRHRKQNRTPAQRLLDGGKISAQERAWIEEQKVSTNPFEMTKDTEARQDRKYRRRGINRAKAMAELRDGKTLSKAVRLPLFYALILNESSPLNHPSSRTARLGSSEEEK